MTPERTLRHPNGGALKIGTGVHVSADSFCTETKISGQSEVFSSMVAHGSLSDAKVFNSRVQGSEVIGSSIAESVCSGLKLHGAILHKVVAAALILAPFEGTQPLTLVDVVAENCELYGNWSLIGNARISQGVWHRKPRFLRITGDGIDFGLTESTDNHAMLGCFRKPLKELLHAGPRLGRKRGWNSSQIQAAKEFYEELADVPLDGVHK